MKLNLTIFHSVTAVFAAYAILWHNALHWLWAVEQTRMSFVIMAIYALCSLYVYVRGYKSNFHLVKFQASMFPVLGILGTIIGLAMIGFQSAGDQTALAKALVEHIGALFVPTGFGVGFLFLLGQQLAIVGEYE